MPCLSILQRRATTIFRSCAETRFSIWLSCGL
jgi:hypothetical protein